MFQHEINNFLTSESPESTIWVAYSGGVDSHVLLHAISQYKGDYTIRAIHVNHNLLPNAKAWTEHCRLICDDLDVVCDVIDVNIDTTSGESVESAARHARYDAFKRCMHKGDFLLTAHHQDDQAETFFLQLLRGAGIKGLAAMPAKKPFAAGSLYRPFLSIARDAIEAYADQHQLNFIEDESNHDLRFARNFVRRELMPMLKERWPKATETIARSCRHIGEANFLLDKLALEDLARLEAGAETVISIEKLLNLSPQRQRNVLRYWIQQNHETLPDEKKLNAIISEVVLAREDSMPCLSWGDIDIRRYQDKLYLLAKCLPHDASRVIDWDIVEPCSLPANIGTLIATPKKGVGITLVSQAVTVRFRQGGERCDIPHRGRQSLKNLFQEWGIPPWQRDRVPLIFIGDELAVVVGFAVCEPFVASEADEGVEVVLNAHKH